MNDTEFRETYRPVHVPAAFAEANTLQDQVIFALAQIAQGTSYEVICHLEKLAPDVPPKEIIAEVHEVLTQLYEKGLINGSENNGELVYNLHKITQANDGQVNPDLLAPGLD